MNNANVRLIDLFNKYTEDFNSLTEEEEKELVNLFDLMDYYSEEY